VSWRSPTCFSRADLYRFAGFGPEAIPAFSDLVVAFSLVSFYLIPIRFVTIFSNAYSFTCFPSSLPYAGAHVRRSPVMKVVCPGFPLLNVLPPATPKRCAFVPLPSTCAEQQIAPTNQEALHFLYSAYDGLFLLLG